MMHKPKEYLPTYVFKHIRNGQNRAAEKWSRNIKDGKSYLNLHNLLISPRGLRKAISVKGRITMHMNAREIKLRHRIWLIKK